MHLQLSDKNPISYHALQHSPNPAKLCARTRWEDPGGKLSAKGWQNRVAFPYLARYFNCFMDRSA
jgi:hypothetical protein